ncbi:MAG TPA: site-specific tyrosine recombinase XerD [Acidimicrobiaceae bacterium]|nr:site-specific tyrosine recombinase XerD [Acidimicrobiaceae bacterium]HCB37597.1 site-specific tyrosine recombinase XerD [Acidimicrobiaceae bacterium]
MSFPPTTGSRAGSPTAGSPTRSLAPAAEEFLAWLASARGRARSTLDAYRIALGAYERWLAERGTTPASAAEDDVASYLAVLRRDRGLAKSTVARAAVAIRGLHRFLLAEEMAARDPAAALDVPKAPRGLPRALTEEQVSALLASPAGDEPLVRRDRAMLEVLYGMGLRVSELVGLSLPDVDLSDRLLRVLGKGSKERIVPLGRHAAAALGDWLSGAGRGAVLDAPGRPGRAARAGTATRAGTAAVFVSARGTRLTRQGAWLVVRKHGDRVGLGPDVLTPHVLRHSCATHMLDHGADIRSVQELLGHASISSTQIYTAVSGSRAAEVYADSHPRARY